MMPTKERNLMDSRELYKLAQLYDFPDYVKDASLQDLQVPPQPNDHRFYADKRSPYDYPVHSKEATYFSHVRWAEERMNHNPRVRSLIESNLEKYAKYWGITNAVARVEKQAAEHSQNNTVRDSDYALVEVVGGQKHHSYPLRNALEVKQAADWFVSNRKELREQYCYADQVTIATNILEKAAQYGAAIGNAVETLERVAGQGTGSKVKIAKMLRDRTVAGYKVATETKAMLLKLAADIEGQSELFLDPATRSTLASTVDEFDRTYGLLNKYSEMIPSPEDVLYEVTRSGAATEKAAAESEIALLTGSVYSADDLKRLDKVAMRDIFGPDIVDELTVGLKLDPEKVADFAGTLTLPDAESFDRIMAESGVSPLRKQAVANAVGFTLDDWTKILEATA